MGIKWLRTLQKTTLKPFYYKRLIDDIFIIWTLGEENLIKFHQELNNTDINIQYDLKYSQDEIQFLDTTVKICNKKLITINYNKPTNKLMYLHAQSNHAPHIKSSLPYSQALHIRRNTTEDQALSVQLDILTEAFLFDEDSGQFRSNYRDERCSLKYC